MEELNILIINKIYPEKSRYIPVSRVELFFLGREIQEYISIFIDPNDLSHHIIEIKECNTTKIQLEIYAFILNYLLNNKEKIWEETLN